MTLEQFLPFPETSYTFLFSLATIKENLCTSHHHIYKMTTSLCVYFAFPPVTLGTTFLCLLKHFAPAVFPFALSSSFSLFTGSFPSAYTFAIKSPVLRLKKKLLYSFPSDDLFLSSLLAKLVEKVVIFFLD